MMSDWAKWLLVTAATVWLAAGTVGQAQAGQLAYVVAHDYAASGPELFGTVDVTTGSFNQISQLSTPGFSIFGMGFGPGGLLYGVGFSFANPNGPGELFSINPTTGATSDLGSVPFSPAGAGNSGNGPLFALSLSTTSPTSMLYSLNPPSNSANLIGTLPFSADGLVAVDSQGNLFAAGNGDGSFYRVNTSTASFTLVGNTGLGLTLYAGTFVGDTLYGFSAGTTNDTIYTIDTSNAGVTPGANITVPTGYDVVAAASAVPEPSSLFLGLAGGLGALSFGLMRRPRLA